MADTTGVMDRNKASANKAVTGFLLNNSVYIFLVALIIVFSFESNVFLSKANISNFFAQLPSAGILTLAVTMILICGHVDLSIASITALAGTLAAYLSTLGMNPVIVILAALASGGVLGFINGYLITRFKLISFILTLGTNYIIRGLLLYQTNAIYVKGVPDWFYDISNTKLLRGYISTNTVVLIILIAVFVFIMNRTRFGRQCYAVGSNPEAARLSGIKVDRHIIKVFTFEGIVAALAGILLMSNLNVGAPAEANGMDLMALAGAIMGGTWFSGGVGTIGGAIAGILTIRVFQSGLSVMGTNSFLQQAVTGIIIVIAIIIDYFRRASAEK